MVRNSRCVDPLLILGYEIDVTPPATPGIPDMQISSDTGTQTDDNLTNVNTPSFDVVCLEIGSTINFYSGADVITSYACTAIGPAVITIAPALVDGVYDFTYTETDSFGNESLESPVLQIEIDTLITTTTINVPTNGMPVAGIVDSGATVLVTTPSGSMCTTIADVGGNYSCILTPGPVHGENITTTATDIFGNTSSATGIAGIDTYAPMSPTIDSLLGGETTITGIGEYLSIITLVDIACTNAPVVVNAGGVWSCDVVLGDAPQAGDTVTATATDSAGNSSTGTFTIPKNTGGKKRPQLELDEIFGNNTEYTNSSTDTVVPTVDNPFNGNMCESNLLIHNNMKNGDTDGRYGSYEKGIVTEVKLLQGHMNRLLVDDYGQQASGPVDGYFRSLTKRGVERLQLKLNQLLPDMKPLVIDGIVGPFTKEAINQSC